MVPLVSSVSLGCRRSETEPETSFTLMSSLLCINRINVHGNPLSSGRTAGCFQVAARLPAAMRTVERSQRAQTSTEAERPVGLQRKNDLEMPGCRRSGSPLKLNQLFLRPFPTSENSSVFLSLAPFMSHKSHQKRKVRAAPSRKKFAEKM